MWRLLVILGACWTGTAIRDITCPTHHLRGAWNGRVGMNCTSTQNNDSYIVIITCYKKVGKLWVNVTHFPASHSNPMNRGEYHNNK